MKKLEKKVNALIDSLNDDESIAVMCVNANEEFMYSSYAETSEIGAGIATILSDYYNDGNKKAATFAKGIVLGLQALIERRDKASLVVLGEITKSVGKAALKSFERSIDDDDIEDCAHCDENTTCPLPSAIKYRKANHIPAPRGKNGKRKKNADEKSN